MDCAECTLHVQRAIGDLPGVESVNVFLASEKAVIQLDPTQVDVPAIHRAVEGAGYSVSTPTPDESLSPAHSDFTRRIVVLLGIVFSAVLFVVVVGEWLGLFETLTQNVPWPAWLAIVLVGGFPVFRKVVRAALKGQVISHTLMTLGVLAAIAVGEWATAVIVVFFMRVGDYVENFTVERARRAVRDLTAMAPQTARVERDGAEQEVPVYEVKIGERVIVRPGEKIPVDGEVVDGQATVNQSTITGEAMPVEVGPGAHVFAATLAQMGSLRVRTIHVGSDTAFGQVVKMVEEAEAHRGDVQRLADKFSAYYLPVVAAIAAITLLVRRDPMATAAVLVVACSCSFALATPIAMLASIGAGAKRGLLIKGSKYLESLAQADVLLVDKTGTLTPLAEAVRAAAQARHLSLDRPEDFESIPGLGVRARIEGDVVAVGNHRMIPEASSTPAVSELEAQGKTLLFVARDGDLMGTLAAADTPRLEVPAALAEVRALGVKHIELLTGDNQRAASALVEGKQGSFLAGVSYRANLLPEDKIAVVKEYQAQGHTVVMVGDGVNDAPALAQADVGIAMGAAGSDVAVEAAHVALMRDDWTLVPEVFRIARRTMRVVRLNIGFTVVYNVVGLSLAALGYLPPGLAAAAQSLPDLGILANSSRLLRQNVRQSRDTR
jgi:Cd2+/Zn2+-exporting ATPase/Cu+-exporting ATPase